MHYFVTGGAGFIGSHLVDRLLQTGNQVTVFDNLSTGRLDFLEEAGKSKKFKLIEGDLLNPVKLQEAMKGCAFVFHLAANADVRFGTEHPRKDLEQNTVATFNVLEAMRVLGIEKIAFSSTGSVYGEAKQIPTPEDASFPVQTSLYGASKLAGEALLQAYAEGFGFGVWIFRFVSILGERYSHGHVFDFYKKLMKDPKTLQVLGDGQQKKSYLYVQDCIEAMLTAIEKSKDRVNIFNLGTDEYIEIKDSVQVILKALGISPRVIFENKPRGWIGDNPFIYLETKKIRSLGWKPKLSIREGIEKTVDYLKINEKILSRA